MATRKQAPEAQNQFELMSTAQDGGTILKTFRRPNGLKFSERSACPIFTQPIAEAIRAADGEAHALAAGLGYNIVIEPEGQVTFERPGKRFCLRADTVRGQLRKALDAKDPERVAEQTPTSDWTPNDGPITVMRPFGPRTFETGLPRELTGEARKTNWRQITKAADFPQKPSLEEPLGWRHFVWYEEVSGRLLVEWADSAWVTITPPENGDMLGSAMWDAYGDARAQLVSDFNASLAEARDARGEGN